MKMYLFIINPIAGSGKALKVWSKVKQELENQNIEYRSFYTKYPGHASEIAQQVAELHKEKVEAIVAVGGDGTIHEVTNGLIHYPHLSIGYIPGGSGNDFARGFSIPKSPMKALHKILKQQGRKPKRYDLGRYKIGTRKKDDRFFVNGIGIGFDGDVAKVTHESGYKDLLNKWKLGRLAYALTAMKLLKVYQPQEMTIHLDGKESTFSNVWFLAINNIAYYGGGMKFSPKALPTDGKLNLCLVHNLSRWKVLSLFITVFFGFHTKFEGVTVLEGKKMEVSSPKPMTIHADGEIIGSTPISVHVDPSCRSIF